jgi:hypothetical protein
MSGTKRKNFARGLLMTAAFLLCADAAFAQDGGHKPVHHHHHHHHKHHHKHHSVKH